MKSKSEEKPEEKPEEELEHVFKSFHHAEKTTDEPLIRVMALHALKYCERLFYLEEVEEIRKADANVFSGRRLHEDLDKGPDVYSLELASEILGLRGKTDCVKRESGQLIVCEHKKGKSKDGVEAWPSDRLQVLAYSLLLAEHAGEELSEAKIRYHADKKTITIPFTMAEAKAEVNLAINRARELRRSLERPPVTVAERLCRNCALAPVCLPEEERFAADEERLPQRFFPPDDDRRVIHLVEQGSSISKCGEQIVVYLPDGTKKALPGMTISALVLHGNIQITTQVLHFCAANDIGVHWLSYGGFYVGALSPSAGPVQRRNRQFQGLNDLKLRVRLCARLVHAKTENQLRYLLRLTRGDDKARSDAVEQGLNNIRGNLQGIGQYLEQIDGIEKNKKGEIDEQQDVGLFTDSLRGLEGASTREYFRLLPHVLSLQPDDFLYFSGRNRRPPKDPFNALLSFGYALLYKDCIAALLAVGLEPSLGFMHTPRSTAYPLALDLMDLFRLILWDMPLIGSINRKQWNKEDFEVTGKQVWLNSAGRRKAIALYEARKSEKWKHPVLDYSLSYSRTIELEARLLEKEWAGQPGLFAKLRLR